MPSHRVFIYWVHPLFYDTVRALLHHPEIEWIGSSSNYSRVIDPTLAPQPDIIIIEEDRDRQFSDMVHVMENTPWNVRLVGLNLEDNEMHIYSFVQQNVCMVDDLLHWILNH
jgi:DNA-binding NarL/FixJ family response regulator